jgi:hypothetical protein
MGILYTVWPLDDSARDWLRSQNIPSPSRQSRWPTRHELQELLAGLSGFSVEYTDNGPGMSWDASISDNEPGDAECWTLLHAEPEGGDDARTKVHFEKGEPYLIVALLRGLSRTVGPLMLMPDVGGPPMIVSPEFTVPEIAEHYCEFEYHALQWEKIRRGVPGAGEPH